MSAQLDGPLAEDQSATVEIFDGDNLIGTATVTGDSWTLDQPVTLALGEHVLTARSDSVASAPWRLAVVDEDVGLTLGRPTVRGAHPEPGDQERLDYYANANKDIEVIVDYTMQQGDSVKLYWTGPSITLGSAIQIIEDDPPRLEPFVISKYEVIDAILRNAVIRYTVKRPPDTRTHESLALDLIVTGDSRGHTFDIPWPSLKSDRLAATRLPGFNEAKPSLNGSTLEVTRLPDFKDVSTVEARAIGQDETDTWQSSAQMFGTNTSLVFEVDSNWLDRNRGKSVKFNYSLRLTPEQPRNYLYSRLLRIKSLS